MRAVIYARFSSDRQTEESIHAQVRACREYADRHGMTITAEYKDEAISGTESKTELRKDYQRLLKDVEKHCFNVILIHKYDRVARSLTEHVNLEVKLKKYNVQLVAVAQDMGNTNESKIMRALLWSMSEYYSDNLAAETRKGHKEIALQGKHNGGVGLFGYDVIEQRYVINELEAEYVRRLFSAVLNREGTKSLIAEMRSKGITGKRGKPLVYSSVNEILHNEKYTGVYLYSEVEETERKLRRSKPNAIRVENAIPAIIDKNTFREVQRIMSEHQQTGRTKTEYLCSGLVVCSCGAKMHGFTSRRKGHEYHYYKCSKNCGARMVKMEEVDKVAKNYLVGLLSEKNQEQIAFLLRNYQGHEQDRIDSFNAALQKKIREREQALKNLMTNMTKTILPAEILSAMADEMQSIKAEIEELKNTEPPEDYSVDMIKDWLNSIKTAPDQKAVQLLIEQIRVENGEKETEYNVLSTLHSVLVNTVAGVHNIDYLKQLIPLLFGYKTTFVK